MKKILGLMVLMVFMVGSLNLISAQKKEDTVKFPESVKKVIEKKVAQEKKLLKKATDRINFLIQCREKKCLHSLFAVRPDFQIEIVRKYIPFSASFSRLILGAKGVSVVYAAKKYSLVRPGQMVNFVDMQKHYRRNIRGLRDLLKKLIKLNNEDIYNTIGGVVEVWLLE